MREAPGFLNARGSEANLLQWPGCGARTAAPAAGTAVAQPAAMSHTELHRISSARALPETVPAARLAAAIAEVALALLVVGVWWVTWIAG